MPQCNEDLDAFLTLLESKLRGPFSSLDLSKTITTNQLRGSLSKTEYLQSVGEVLSRTEKSTQLSALIGLLGLDPSDETDKEVHKILTNAQSKSLYVEEWVRVVSGLVHGIMFAEKVEADSDLTDEEATIPLIGREADDVLEKTCQEIIERVRRFERYSAVAAEGIPGKESSLAMDDADPTFAPFRFALLHTDLLENVLPEVKHHHHFNFDEKAEVLVMDSKLEATKAQEEYEHSLQSAPQTTIDASKRKDVITDEPQAILPGMNRKPAPVGTTKLSVANRPKSNLFIPAKKPTFAAQNPKLQKPGLKVRKAGAAQDLLKSKKSRLMGTAGVASGLSGTSTSNTANSTSLNSSNKNVGVAGTSVAARGRANRMLQSTGASKMKMLDMNEVQGLEKEKFEKEQQLTNKFRKKNILSGLKRKAAPTSNGQSTESKIRRNSASAAANDNDVDDTEHNDTDYNDAHEQAADNNSFADMHNNDDDDDALLLLDRNPPTNSFLNIHNNDDDNDDDAEHDLKPAATKRTPQDGFGDPSALAAAAMGAYQAHMSQRNATSALGQAPATSLAAASSQQASNSSSNRHHDWRLMLKEKSNKLSSDDRFRIQQFFADRYNPTPEQPTYKMKLHEERTTDPKTGEPVKETFYLELDYNTFTSKQSKKVKRY